MKFVALLIVITCVLPVSAEMENQAGKVQFANSGSESAQERFLYGLAQLHNFEYDSAAEAFQAAQKQDPGFAMAYWAEAMTKNHPIWMEQEADAARSVLKKLGATAQERIAKAPTEREKNYLRTIEVLYGKGDKESRDFQYAEAMRDLAKKYPEDPNAAAFYALSLLGTAHDGRDTATYMRAAAVLEEVFQKHPQHPGVIHYLIHCYDDPTHAPLGLRAAHLYSKIAPAAGHAQHMTSHIYIAMGMWDEVVAANENAVNVVNQQRAANGQPLRYCGHYNFWLEYGYLQQNRIDDAKEVLHKCYGSAKEQEKSADHMGMTSMDPDATLQTSFLQMRLRYLIDTGDWKGEVASWDLPSVQNRGARMNREFTIGFGAAELGKTEEAKASLARLKKLVAEEYSKAKKSGEEAYRKRADILAIQLDAKIAQGEGRLQQALDLLRDAAAQEENMPFEFGPPFIDKPSRELLGEILLQANQPKEAEKEFQAALLRAPLRAASVQGLARCAGRSGKPE
ncbi:MAG TPA: hypothetical protein VI958_03485 [Acidobacteriota bacterium]